MLVWKLKPKAFFVIFKIQNVDISQNHFDKNLFKKIKISFAKKKKTLKIRVNFTNPPYSVVVALCIPNYEKLQSPPQLL